MIPTLKGRNRICHGIMEDIRWLGFEWNGGLYFASDYYQQCYDIMRTLSGAAWPMWTS